MVTMRGVEEIRVLGNEYLVPAGVGRTTWVVTPDAMFYTRRKSAEGVRSQPLSGTCSHIGSAVVAGGMYGLGIGLAQPPYLTETTLFDILDVKHHFFGRFTNGRNSLGVLGVVSFGLGALTIVRGPIRTARAIVEGAVRMVDLFSGATGRKWAASVIGAIALGATAYVILDLPNSIPRTVGRRLRASILHGDGSKPPVSFVDAHTERVAEEARAVLRYGGCVLKEKFRELMDQRSNEIKNLEDAERRERNVRRAV